MGHMDMGVDLRVVSCSRDSCVRVRGCSHGTCVEGLGTTTFYSENHNGFVYYTFFFFLKRIHHINNNAVPW